MLYMKKKKNLFFKPTPTVTLRAFSPVICPIVFCTDLNFVGWKFEMVFLLSVVETSKNTSFCINHFCYSFLPDIHLKVIPRY